MQMRNGYATLFAVFLFVSAMAQTTDELIERHIKALGGRDNIGSDKMITVYTADGGWSVNTMMGVADPQLMKPERFRQGFELLFVGRPLYDCALRGSKAELLGTSAEGYKIKLTNKYNIVTTIYVDTVTLLIRKTVQRGLVSGEPACFTQCGKRMTTAENIPLLPPLPAYGSIRTWIRLSFNRKNNGWTANQPGQQNTG
jgi:hypothetical protein